MEDQSNISHDRHGLTVHVSTCVSVCVSTCVCVCVCVCSEFRKSDLFVVRLVWFTVPRVDENGNGVNGK